MIHLIRLSLIWLWRRNIVATVLFLTICVVGVAAFLSSLALQLSSKVFQDTIFAGIEIILIGTLIYELAHFLRSEKTARPIPLLISRWVSYTKILMSFLFSYRLASWIYLLVISLIRSSIAVFLGAENYLIFIVFYGIFFKAVLISSLVLLVSLWSRPLLTMVVSVVFYTVGHMVWLLNYYTFIQKNLSIWSLQWMVTKLISVFLPHLDSLSFVGTLYSFEQNRNNLLRQWTIQNSIYLIILLILILLISKTKKNFIPKHDW